MTGLRRAKRRARLGHMAVARRRTGSISCGWSATLQWRVSGRSFTRIHGCVIVNGSTKGGNSVAPFASCAVDQVLPSGGLTPITEYYFWPRVDAWEEMKASLEKKTWIAEADKIILLNRTTGRIHLHRSRFWARSYTLYTGYLLRVATPSDRLGSCSQRLSTFGRTRRTTGTHWTRRGRDSQTAPFRAFERRPFAIPGDMSLTGSDMIGTSFA